MGPAPKCGQNSQGGAADVDRDPPVPVFPAHLSGADTWCQSAREWITTQSPLTVSPAEQTALGQMLQHSADGPVQGG